MSEALKPPEPYWASEDGGVTLLLGKCERVLWSLPENSVDAVVCDPPYDLTSGKKGGSGPASLNEAHPAGRSRITTGGGFMGQAWDATGVAFNPATWRAVMRVLKPGGYLLAFGGSRTWHRLVCAIEDAGFEIRDPIADLTGMDAPGLLWIQGQGYPKNLDVSKAIDKTAGRQGVSVHVLKVRLRELFTASGKTFAQIDAECGFRAANYLTLGAEGKRPDPWINVLPSLEKWQRIKRVIGIDSDPALDAELDQFFSAAEREVIAQGFRIRRDSTVQIVGNSDGAFDITAPGTEDAARWDGWGTALKPAWEPVCVARKPLAGTVAQNVLQYGTGALNLDGCRVGTDVMRESRMSQTPGGVLNMNGRDVEHGNWQQRPNSDPAEHDGRWPPNLVLGETAAAEMDRQSGVIASGKLLPHHADNGKAAGTLGAFAGASGRESYGDTGGASRFFPVFRYEPKAPAHERPRLPDGTAWPTVKPLDFIRWLVRLVTPPGGTVGDFFLGSGPTAEACVIEGFPFLGIDQDERALRLTIERLSKPIQPVMLTVDDSAPAAPVRPAAASRPKPAPEAHPSLFDLEDAS